LRLWAAAEPASEESVPGLLSWALVSPA
jgi:hypothetical protein